MLISQEQPHLSYAQVDMHSSHVDALREDDHEVRSKMEAMAAPISVVVTMLTADEASAFGAQLIALADSHSDGVSATLAPMVDALRQLGLSMIPPPEEEMEDEEEEEEGGDATDVAESEEGEEDEESVGEVVEPPPAPGRTLWQSLRWPFTRS